MVAKTKKYWEKRKELQLPQGVDSGGQFYPTKNPQFIPSGEGSQIRFNPNKTVTYNGKTLKPEEYNAVLGKGGIVTPAVQEILNQKTQAAKEREITGLAEKEFLKTEMIGELRTQKNIEKNKDVLARIGQPIPPQSITGKPVSDILVEAGMNVGDVLRPIGQQAGAAGGALLGSVVPGIGTALGAGVGAGLGLLTGLLSGIKSLSVERRQDTKEAYNDYTNSKTRIEGVITALNNKQIEPQQAYEYYAIEWKNIAQVELRLKKLTATAIGRQLSKALDEQADVLSMIEYKDLYDRRFELAITNPTPKFVPEPVSNVQE